MATHRLGPAQLALLGLSLGALTACATPRYGKVERPRAEAPSGRVPGTMRPYQINGVWYRPREQPDYNEVGIASWYGQQFHNKTTANGERFDMRVVSAAHKTLPLPCIVEVTNLDNGKKIRVRVNDRGPFVAGRIIDMSRAGAEALGFAGKGTARVRVRYVGPAPSRSADKTLRYAGQVPDKVKPERPAASGSWLIQAGAFGDRDNAERAAAALREVGKVRIDRSPGGLYRVQVGPVRNPAEAARLRDTVAGYGFPDAAVIADR